MTELKTKRAWAKPEVVTLDVEKTLGGDFLPFSESIVFTAPGFPDQPGTS